MGLAERRPPATAIPGWLSSHSVVPPVLPGAWRKVPGWLADPRDGLKIPRYP
jgi:D-amino-acid dehydrogenase